MLGLVMTFLAGLLSSTSWATCLLLFCGACAFRLVPKSCWSRPWTNQTESCWSCVLVKAWGKGNSKAKYFWISSGIFITVNWYLGEFLLHRSCKCLIFLNMFFIYILGSVNADLPSPLRLCHGVVTAAQLAFPSPLSTRVTWLKILQNLSLGSPDLKLHSHWLTLHRMWCPLLAAKCLEHTPTSDTSFVVAPDLLVASLY